jgi:beta-lactam-binding protein with PASTA domain/tRNA A-37 threonylcarbamoyl transferase component Bud32
MQPVTTPRVFSGRYELTHLVARGGMAQVYRARDRLLDRPVALKVLFPELSVDRAFVERFRREAQAAANLSHPNIVPVFDWGEDNGTYYIVMEYVDGQPLSQALRTGGPMPATRVAQIGARVADALAYAHRHGVIHRDVKPGNVLLTDDEQVKVTDFGIARAVNTEESLTQTGAVMGTATYFSPEQAEGVGVDARSDIYSLGVVLFEMVAGRPPFLGDSPVAVASKHVREQPPALHDLSPSVPPALEAVIAKAMAKSADLRYQSAADLRADLQRFADGRQVAAADPAMTATLAAEAAATTAAAAGGPAADAARTGVLAPMPTTQAVPLGDGRVPSGSEPHVWRWALLLLGLLVILGVVIYFVLRSLGYVGTTKFAMPTLQGKAKSAAVKVLQSDGLVVSLVTERTSTTVPATKVIATVPGAGTKAYHGERVELIVSRGGVPRVPLPTVKGEQYSHAYAKLFALGLSPTEALVASTKATGTVLGETPPAGQRVKKGSVVTLTVATRNSVVVPDVVGDTVASAGDVLGATGLAAGAVSTVCSNQYGKGIVISQSPKAGTRVAPGAKVDLEVSSGPCNVLVPNVVGDSETLAVSTLSSKGLRAIPATTAACVAATDGRVLAQTPVGGTTVKSGSTVAISVCRSPVGPPTSTTPTTPKTPPGHSALTPSTVPVSSPTKKSGA